MMKIMTLLALLALPFICTAEDFELSAQVGDEVAVIDLLTPVSGGFSLGVRYVADFDTSSTASSYIIRDHYFGPSAKFEIELGPVVPYVSASALWDVGDDIVLTGGPGVGFEFMEGVTGHVGYMWSDDDLLNDMWLFGLAVKF